MDSKKAIIDDIIQWHQEQAHRTGAIGFIQDSGGLDDVFKDWTVESTPDPSLQEPPGGAFDLMATASKLQADTTLADNRHTDRKQALDKDKLLQADVRYEIRRRLLRAGKTQQEIDENTANMTSLTMLTAYLYKIEHPPPSVEVRIAALVYTNFRGTKRPTPIRLSPKDDFPELLATLKEFVLAKAESTGKPVTACENVGFVGSWKYKMSTWRDGTQKLVDATWTSLASDSDYRTMLKKISNHEGENFMPVLMPVNPVPPCVTPTRPTSTGSVTNGNIQKSASPTQSLSQPKRPSSATIEANGEDAKSCNGIPVGMEELLEGTEPVDWADLARRYMEGEDLFGVD